MKYIFYLFLLIFSYASHFGMRAPMRPIRPHQAMRLAARIIPQRQKLIHTQHDLLAMLSNIDPKKFKPAHVEPLIKALAHHHVVAPLAANRNTLERSIKKFINTPGFFPTLQSLFVHALTDANSFKGSLFELEQALTIAEKNDREKVIGINQRVSCPDKVRIKQYDVCTTDGYIECKFQTDYH